MSKYEPVYIVAAQRTPVCRAFRGGLRNARPDDMLAHVIRSTLDCVPEFDTETIGDVIIGCAMPEGEQGMNVARIGSLLAGLPDAVPGMTINRFCSSGIQAVALAADRIRLGEEDVMLAGGTESMSMVPMMGRDPSYNPSIFDNENVGIAFGMGITAEKVAQGWGISREAQDLFAAKSHAKALSASESGEFTQEISEYTVVDRLPGEDGCVRALSKMISFDDGPRPGSSVERLSSLSPAFYAKGVVTAGNSSQMSDGAAAVLLASESAVKRHNFSPLAEFVSYATAGVPAEIMGIGPIKAIPKALQRAGLKQNEIDWIELNEAFAAQSLAVIKDLGLDDAKINPLGGAIALGHPLGATGAVRIATLAHGLKRHNQKLGMVTMCIGTGMGAAGIIRAC